MVDEHSHKLVHTPTVLSGLWSIHEGELGREEENETSRRNLLIVNLSLKGETCFELLIHMYVDWSVDGN